MAINSSYQSSTEITLPANTVDGDYKIVVLTDGNNQVFERNGESNNLGAANNITKVSHADIVPTLISAPATALSGSNVDLSWSVTNQGTSATINSWKDKVYISDNATFEADRDRVFGEFEYTESLMVGETKEISVNTSLPEDTIGNKYILIVSDADNDLVEAIGENNNVVTNPI